MLLLVLAILVYIVGFMWLMHKGIHSIYKADDRDLIASTSKGRLLATAGMCFSTLFWPVFMVLGALYTGCLKAAGITA